MTKFKETTNIIIAQKMEEHILTYLHELILSRLKKEKNKITLTQNFNVLYINLQCKEGLGPK